MRVIRREMIVAFVSVAIVACGGQSSTEVTGVAARACSPLMAPASLTVEAATTDGHYFVATKDNGATHLFYGTPDHMTEAQLTHEDSGCGWYPDFAIGTMTYSAVIAPSSCGNSVWSRIYVGTDPAVVPMRLTLLRVFGAVDADAGATPSPETFTYSCF